MAPALNFLYADRKGNIGFFGAGRIPIRSRGDGTVPVPGWTGEYQWNRSIPFEQLPQTYNPDSCYLVSANNRNVDAAYPYHISDSWALPARAKRISELLEAKTAKREPVTARYMQQMQGDLTDLSSRELARFLGGLRFAEPREHAAVEFVKNWDGEMSADSQGAAIFLVWSKFLRQELFGRRLPGYWNMPQDTAELRSIVDSTSYDQILAALTQSRTWCGEGSRLVPSCSSILEKSLEETLSELTRLSGSDPRDWHWGRIHTTVYAHVPFSALGGVVAELFERRISHGGSSNTIDAAPATFRDSVGYEQSQGASFRQIIQPGTPAVHFYMNSTGQSGNLLSPHFDDMIRPFRNVEYYELPLTPPAKPAYELTLVP